MRWTWLFSAVALLTPTLAIFSDDAFTVDYHQALLGFPQSHTTFFHKPQSASNASLLYTISDKGVLGAVNPRDGSLVWRQVLSGQPSESAANTFLVAGETDGRVTSGFQSTISSWDALDGRLNWLHDFGAGLVVKDVQVVPNLAQAAENTIQDIVAVAVSSKDGLGATVARIAGDGSNIRWEHQDKSATQDVVFSLAVSPKHVYYVTKSSGILSGGKAKVVALDLITGKEISQHSVTLDSEAVGPGGALSIGSGSEAPFLVSSEKPYKSIKLNVLGTSKTTSINLENKGEEIQGLRVLSAGGSTSTPHFLVHVQGVTRHWAEVYHVNLKSGDATKAYSLPATAETSTFAATEVGGATYFVRITDSEVSLYSSASHGQLGKWPRSISGSQSSSQLLHAAAEVSSRGTGGYALRVALTSRTTGWSLIRNGETSWSRPEQLAYITKAIWSDDASSTSLVHEMEVEAASNPITAYVHRLTRHLADLRLLPQYLLNIPNAVFKSGNEVGKSTREKLVGSMLILAATSKGEILALDATNAGATKWTVTLPKAGNDYASVVHLSVDASRLTAYLHDGQFFVIDVANGQVLDKQKSSKPFGKIIELPGQPASTIVNVSPAGKPEVFSELAPANPTEGSIVVTINDKGEAIGWSIGSVAEQIWTLRPDNGAKITDVVGRSLHDPVSSIGQVLGDRSVLYKYINPNVALLTALSSTALTIYVVNAVTGAVLHTATHEGVLVNMPVAAVGSGHKFAYSFTIQDPATSGLSTQFVVSELFESEEPNDRGLLMAKANYSSFSPDAGAKPWVQSRAFTIAEPLSHLAVTQTSQGITSRQVLAYLSESQSVLGIPGEILNARRPIDRDPTATEMEEGLMRYNTILDLDPKFFLSHSRDVVGIQEILTAPTVLESTSLVFAFGHDIFGIQIAPSNTFDVLGKGFKRIQLVLTVVALYAGVLAIRPIARKKMVERRWL